MSEKPKSGFCDLCGDYSTVLTVVVKDEEPVKMCSLCVEEEQDE